MRIGAGLAAALAIAAGAANADSEFSIVVQGGAAKYNQDVAGGGTNTGAEYGARLGIIPFPAVGLELGYLGSQNSIRGLIDNSPVTLRTDAGYADLRVNLLTDWVTPYVFGGYGHTWYSGATIAGIRSQDLNTLPFGGGVDVNIGMFKVGGRFQYNYMFQQLTVSAAGGTPRPANADFYGVSLDLGASFH